MDELSPMGEFVGTVAGSDQVLRCTSSVDGLRVGVSQYSREDLPNGSIIDVTVFSGIAGKQKTFSATITDEAFDGGVRFPQTADMFKEHDKKIVPIAFRFTRVEMGDGMFVGTVPWIPGLDHHGFVHHRYPDAGVNDNPDIMGYFTGHVEGKSYIARCTSNVGGTILVIDPFYRDTMVDGAAFEIILFPGDPMREALYRTYVTDDLFTVGQSFTSSMDLFLSYAGEVLPIAFRYVPPGRGLFVGSSPDGSEFGAGYLNRDYAAVNGYKHFGEFTEAPTGADAVNRFSINSRGWTLALNPGWRELYANGTAVKITLWKDQWNQVEFNTTIQEEHWGVGVEVAEQAYLLNYNLNEVIPFELVFTAISTGPGFDIATNAQTYPAGNVNWVGWVSDEYVNNLARVYGGDWNRVQPMGSIDPDHPIARDVSAFYSFTSDRGEKGVVIALREDARSRYPVGTDFSISIFEGEGEWERWASFTVNEDSFVTGSCGDPWEGFFGDYIAGTGKQRVTGSNIYTRDASIMFPEGGGTLQLAYHFEPFSGRYYIGRAVEADVPRKVPKLGHHYDPYSEDRHFKKIGYLYSHDAGTFFGLKKADAKNVVLGSVLNLVFNGNDGANTYTAQIAHQTFLNTGAEFNLQVYKRGRSRRIAMFPDLSNESYDGIKVARSADRQVVGWGVRNGVQFGDVVGANADWYKSEILGLWVENGQLVSQLPANALGKKAVRVELYVNVNGTPKEVYYLINQGNGLCRTTDLAVRPGDNFVLWEGAIVPFSASALWNLI